MYLSRRTFLQSTAVYSAMGMAPRFLTEAAAATIGGFKDDRVLVVIQLAGGNDGLSTLVPHTDDAYHNARPRLGLKKERLLKLTDDLAFNSKMAGLKGLYDGGDLAVIQGVGYPNPNRSHFRSTEIWQTASGSNQFLGTGWVGRYFDNNCSGTARPQVGLALTKERPQAFDSKKGHGIATENPDRFGWQPGKEDPDAFGRLNYGKIGPSTLDFLRHTAHNAMSSSEEVKAAAKLGKAKGTQPRGAFPQLDTIASLIRGGLSTRVYFVKTGGYDTHANQTAAHDRLMENLSSALVRFQTQLKKDGTADRVATMVFSEFGRRVKENGSGGTDHGTAAPMFLMGKGVKAGLYGDTPSLTDLDRGDLKFTTDFRGVYSSVLKDWLKVDPKTVLGKKFDAPPLFG